MVIGIKVWSCSEGYETEKNPKENIGDEYVEKQFNGIIAHVSCGNRGGSCGRDSDGIEEG
jgi:hypothetical protein